MLTYQNLPFHIYIPHGFDLQNALMRTIGSVQSYAENGYWDEEPNEALIQMLQAAIDEINRLKPAPIEEPEPIEADNQDDTNPASSNIYDPTRERLEDDDPSPYPETEDTPKRGRKKKVDK